MKRPGLITALAIVQLSIAAASLSIAGYLLALTRTPELANDQDAGSAIRLGALSISLFAVPTLISAVGLWKMKSWGRWLAVALNAITVAAFLYDPIVDRDPMDGGDISVTIIFSLLLILFLLPAVGRQLKGVALQEGKA